MNSQVFGCMRESITNLKPSLSDWGNNDATDQPRKEREEEEVVREEGKREMIDLVGWVKWQVPKMSSKKLDE